MKSNLLRFKRVFLPLSFLCLAVFAGNLKAQAEDLSSERVPLSESAVSAAISAPSQPTPRAADRVVKPVPGKVAQSAIGLSSLRSSQGVKTSAQVNFTESSISSGTVMAQGTTQPDTSGTPTQTQSAPQPVQTPVQTETTPTQTTPQIQPTVPTETTPTQTAPQTTPIQTQISPGRSTRSGSSYVGVGGNIGIGSGDTALGEGSFAVISKIGLQRSFSVRPSLLFSGDVTILLPVTYDFSFGEGPTESLGFTAAPYVGIGAAISTGNGANVALLLTGGVDVPISSQFTATAAVNATVTGETAIGVLVGVGYNFSGF